MRDVRPPSFDTDTSFDLSGGETHRFAIDLPHDHFFEVTALQDGIDVRLRLVDAEDDTLLVEIDSPNGVEGSERLAWIAPTSGPRRLEVVSSNEDADSGRYHLRISAPRPATQEDRLHAEAFEYFATAEAIRQNQDERPLAEALPAYERAKSLWASLDRDEWRLEALDRTARIHEKLGASNEARPSLLAARDLARALEARSEEILLENRLVRLAFATNDLDTASEHLARAWDLAHDLGDDKLQAAVLGNMAVERFRRGALEEAIDLFYEQADRWERLGRALDRARSLENIATVLTRQGKARRAAEVLGQCVEAYRLGDDPAGLAAALLRYGTALLHDGRHRQALAAFEQAHGFDPEKHLGPERSVLLATQIGQARVQLGEYDEALAHYERALEAARGLETRHAEAILEFNLAALHQRAGRFDDAEALFRVALEHFEHHERDDEHRAMASFGLGLALRDRGEARAAIKAFERAATIVESLRLGRASWDFRMHFLGGKQRYFEEWIDLLMQLHVDGEVPDGEPGAPGSFAEQALDVAERRRARTLLDAVAESVLDQGAEADRAIREEMRKLTASLAHLDRENEAPLSNAERRELLARLDALRARLRRDHPRYEGLGRPAPVGLERLREQVLDPETQLVVFSLGERRSFAFLVDPEEGLTSWELPERAEIRRAVDRARQRVQTVSEQQKRRRRAALEALADTLFSRFARELRRERLAIVPDGELELVPFAALRLPDESSVEGASYLVERHELVILPSGSVLDAVRARDPLRARSSVELSLFADPVFSRRDERVASIGENPAIEASPWPEGLGSVARSAGLALPFPRLPATAREAEAIAALFPRARVALGFQARRSPESIEALEASRILHFATHGISDAEHPELSGLVLSLLDESGQPIAGYLRGHEISALQLTAELVVLSACRTGVGPRVPGEGVLSLARSFLYAGAPRVVLSLWNVADESTATLMSDFYRAFRETASASTALRSAQLAALADPERAEPFYWAAFQTFGDWQSIRPRTARGSDDPIEVEDTGQAMLDPDGADVDYPGGFPAEPASEQTETKRSSRGEGEGEGEGRSPVESPDELDPADFVNGLDADTGEPLPPAPDDREIVAHAAALRFGPRLARDFQWWVENHAVDDPERLPVHGIDPENLAEAGWGVIYAPGTPPEVEEALAPLLSWRRDQAGRRFYPRVHYERGWDSLRFRTEHEIGFGPADPEVLPYYLLLVGDPRELPFEVQYGLDVQYAVGRLHLDSPQEYRRYAESVVTRESGAGALRDVALFDVAKNTRADRMMRDFLVDPLERRLASWRQEKPGRPRIERARDGSKATLHRLLAEAPGFLFAAAHGLRCRPDDRLLSRRQGALVCSEYAGSGPIPADAYFSGSDVPPGVDLDGLVAFLFACYGAGVPEYDDFLEPDLGSGERIAPYPMVSHLAKRLLASGAGAVVGHIDRAWSLSFSWTRTKGDQTKVFDSVVRQFLEGARLGHALEWIDQRYAETATSFNTLLEARFGDLPDGDQLVRLRKTTMDARNYVVLGDPAVRLPGYG